MKKAILVLFLLSCLAGLTLQIILTPSPTKIWGDDLSDSNYGVCYHQVVFGSAEFEPMVAIVTKYLRGDDTVRTTPITLVTTELPHAVYIGGKRVRGERNRIVLYANSPASGEFVRVPVNHGAALQQFRQRSVSRESIVAFWNEHIAPHVQPELKIVESLAARQQRQRNRTTGAGGTYVPVTACQTFPAVCHFDPRCRVP